MEKTVLTLKFKGEIMEPRILDNSGAVRDQGQEEKGEYTLVIASDSTITQAPAGWTVTDSGTGDYTINHTIGHANIAVIAQAIGTATQVVQVSAIDADSFDVNVFDAGDGLTAEDALLHIFVRVLDDAQAV